jgi:hypothetical protein
VKAASEWAAETVPATAFGLLASLDDVRPTRTGVPDLDRDLFGVVADALAEGGCDRLAGVFRHLRRSIKSPAWVPRVQRYGLQCPVWNNPSWLWQTRRSPTGVCQNRYCLYLHTLAPLRAGSAKSFRVDQFPAPGQGWGRGRTYLTLFFRRRWQAVLAYAEVLAECRAGGVPWEEGLDDPSPKTAVSRRLVRV